MRWFLAVLIFAFIALHQDFWLWTNKTLVFGFVPAGLAYHLAYSVAAAGLMWVLVRTAWPEHLEHPQPAAAEETAP